jgi:TolB-like protein/cytochrome c-type biogenesis protein CcmH/NrfG
MEIDEAGTLAALKALRQELIDPRMAAYGGRIVKLMGDGMLAEFPSVVDSVACAIDIQEAVAKRNVGIAAERRVTFRVGINLGDVIVEEEDLYGDGVNVAARIEQLAEPGGIAVSGTVREQIEGKLDARFADAGEHRVKNIARPVRVWHWSPMAEAAAALASAASAGSGPPAKPSIAVLPFENLSGDAEQELFADGITDDVITLLSRVRWLFVIARTSTFTYKGRAVDVQTVAQEMGVRYVLEGSVRRAGQRIRVTAQLIDAATRHHVWAERYDREIEDVFVLQDEITEAIVAAVEPELGSAEQQSARRRPPDNLDAWSAYQRGLWHVYRFNKEDNAEALRLFEQAIALDDQFAPAHAGRSFAQFVIAFLGYSDRRDEAIEQAYLAAKQSVALDDRDAFGHWALARTHFLRREPESALAELEAALDLNPSFAQAHYFRGWVLSIAGRPEEALPHLDKAYRLSPRDPLLFAFMTVRAQTLILMGRHEEALEWATRAARQSNVHFHALGPLVSSLGHLGRIDEAKRALSELLQRRPDYSCTLVETSFPYRRRKDLEHYLEGLRKAGLPE